MTRRGTVEPRASQRRSHAPRAAATDRQPTARRPVELPPRVGAPAGRPGPFRPGAGGPPADRPARGTPAGPRGAPPQPSARAARGGPRAQARSRRPTRASARRRTIRTAPHRLADRFSAGQPRRRADHHARRDAARARGRAGQGRPAADDEGDALRSAGAEQWTRDRAAARPARHDLRPQRRGAGAVGAGQHRHRQPAAGRGPGGHGATFADVLGLSDRAARRAGRGDGRQGPTASCTSPARSTTSSPSSSRRSSWPASTIYREDRRILPGGDTGRSVIGRTDIDGVGIAGLEQQYDDVLDAATPGEIDRRGGPGRPLDRRQRAVVERAGPRQRHRADDRPLGAVRRRAGAARPRRRDRRRAAGRRS